MSILRIGKIFVLVAVLSLSLSACSQLDPSSSEQSIFNFAQKSTSKHFDSSYLLSSPWYAVATNTKNTQCLSKFVFWKNDVLTATNFNNGDGATIESEDLIFVVTPDTRLTISTNMFYNYQSHGSQFFITTEAHFFRDYDEAIRYADERGVDCRHSFPK